MLSMSCDQISVLSCNCSFQKPQNKEHWRPIMHLSESVVIVDLEVELCRSFYCGKSWQLSTLWKEICQLVVTLLQEQSHVLQSSSVFHLSWTLGVTGAQKKSKKFRGSAHYWGSTPWPQIPERILYTTTGEDPGLSIHHNIHFYFGQQTHDLGCQGNSTLPTSPNIVILTSR